MPFIKHRIFAQGPVAFVCRRADHRWAVTRIGHVPLFATDAVLEPDRDFEAWLHPEDGDRIARQLTQCQQQPGSPAPQQEILEYRLANEHGQYLWCREYSHADPTDPSKRGGYLLAITEPTETIDGQTTTPQEQIFQSNRAIGLMIDPQSGRVLHANKAAESFYGYQPEEFRQLNIADINSLPPEQIRAEMQLALKEKRPYFNFRHRLRNGEMRDVCVYSGPLEFQGRQVLYSVIHDTSRLRQAEAALRKSERQSRSFIETTADGFLSINKYLEIIYANQALCELTGYELTDLLGCSVLDLVPAEHRQALREQLNLAHIQVHQDADLFLNHKDGQPLIVRFRATTMEDGSGIFAFLTDITAQRRNEVQLRKLSRAVEYSASSIMITDNQGIIEYVNPRFCEVTGYQSDEVIGETPNLLSTRETPKQRHRELWQTIKAGDNWHGETCNRTKSGAAYWSLMSISPIKNEQGEISHYISVSEDISAQKDHQRKMEQLALYDPLTGLANRRLLTDRLDQATRIIRRQRQPGIAVMMLDLDRFKLINDSYGHDVGDALLKEVAQRLTGCVRKEDTVSRLGGDEFTLLLQEVNKPEDVQLVAQKILHALHRPIAINGYQFNITSSIGISLAPQDGCEPGVLLKNADLALYRAKDNGRNNFQFFTAGMQQKLADNQHFKSELIRGLEDDHFLLHYLPLMDLDSNRMLGIEALVRFQHPNRGLLAPEEFLERTEFHKLHSQLGGWVLREALITLQRLHTEGANELHLAVNISPGQFSAPDFVDELATMLRQCALPPRCLHLEIDEHSLLREPAKSAQILEQLHQLGCAITINDFGTELSSLSLLQQFHIDSIKLHRQFVSQLPVDERSLQLTRAIIAMARELEIEVIAVGIENTKQYNLLRQQGCSQGQGFYFGQPLSAGQLDTQLSTLA